MCIRDSRCTVCMRNRKPGEARPSKLPRTARFGSRLMIDIFYEPDCTGREYMFQGETDEGTHLHVASLVEDRSPATLWAALRDSWFSPFGSPDELLCDKEGANTSEEFLDCCRDLGVRVRHVPADAHYQLGKQNRRISP